MALNQRYHLQERIGSGGEAEVWRAMDLAGGGEVAVRLTSGAPREMNTAIGTAPVARHAHWVRLLDCGADPARGSYSVFELLRGETLRASVARSSLPRAAWLDFVGASLAAVEALHRAGLVHGDLNADNFLLHEDGNWKLLELPQHRPPGPARSPLFGSIYTLAPEQFAGHQADASCDLYALGCLYYFAAAGIYPHAGGSEADLAVERLRFAALPLSRVKTDLPSPCADWVMRLLQREPAHRFPDVAEARQLLELAT